MNKIICALVPTAGMFFLLAADWPQYRGPLRDDLSQETGLLKSWPEKGPSLLWRHADLGIGYSGVAVVGGRLYTIGARGETEFLIALDLKPEKSSVREAWAKPVGPLFDFKGNKWSAGPSSTPTVDGDLCFALGGNGDLICVRSSDGHEKWRRNLSKDLEAEVNPIGGGPKKLGWGFTWSPLVDGDKLICLPGGPKGTVAALNKNTGEVIWRSSGLTDQAAYTSPMVAEIGQTRQYVVLTNQGLAGVSASNGQLLWSHRRKPGYGTEVVNSPIVRGEFIFTTVGAGQGSDLLRVRKPGNQFQAETVYSNKQMMNHHGNVALIENHVYGHSEGKGWMCLDFQKGEPVWAERNKLGAGSMTYADGHIYCFSEDNGTVVLIEAVPTGWKEKGRFRLPETSNQRKPSGRIWTPPVVSNGRLYLRDQELLFCFDIQAK